MRDRAVSKAIAAVVAAIIVVALVGVWWFFLRRPPTAPPPTAPPPLKKTLHTQVLYIISPDEMTRIELYKAGVADIAAVTPARWKEINRTKVDDHELVLLIKKEKPRLTIQYVLLNCQREPFNMPEVRRALAYATPYDTILGQIFGGLYTELHTIIPKGMPGYTDFNMIDYKFDFSKAKEIIERLKKERGFDPGKYTIVIMYNLGNTARAQIAALLQNFWTRLGFKVYVETYAWPEYLRRVDHFDFDVALIGWIPDYLDPDNYLMPFAWGGAEFTELKYFKDVSPADVGKYISKVERAIETEKYVVVVGPKGTGATYEGPTEKPLIVVSYVLDEEKTRKNWEEPISMVTVGAANWRDVPVSALIKLAREILDPEVREVVLQAVAIAFNHEVPMIMLGQAVTGENRGSWVQEVYYPLGAAFMRYDIVWELPDAPVKDTGVLDVKNDPSTMVIATFGWPDTFDPAKTYESFGWEILWHIASRLVTYNREQTEPIPELAVAWAFSKDATELYFVIRGGVVAYDPWNKKTYPIDATDVLFSMWRVVRLNLPGSPVWMIRDFIDVNASTVMSESELDEVAKTKGLIAVYKGKSKEVRSLSELLEFFGYKGDTAGVVKFKLRFPYPPIIHIFSTVVTSVLPMEYLLGDAYDSAIAASDNGRSPAAWAKFVKPGEDDPTHKLMAEKPPSTGPYYLADYKEDAYILLKINPRYWNATFWEERYGYKP